MLLANRPLFLSGCADRLFRVVRAAFLVFILSSVSYLDINAQTDTWGREFYLSLFPNPGSNPKGFLHIQSLETTTIEVVYGTSLPQTYDIPAGGLTIELTADWLQRITATQANGKNGKSAIHVTSEAKIQVAISHHREYSMDATTALPVTAGGHHYIVPTYDGSGRANIINTGGRTVVRLIPKLNIEGWPAGEERTVLLDEGEVYSVAGKDLSGFEIIASKDESILELPGPPPPPGGGLIENLDCDPLMVYVGNESTIIAPCDGPSHMLEALPPVAAQGKEYVFLPFIGRVDKNYRVVVVGIEDTTTMQLTNMYSPSFILEETDTIKLSERIQAGRWPIVIKANKPIVTSQLGFNHDGCNTREPLGTVLGGPMAVVQPSFDQATDEAVVYVSEMLGIDAHYFNVAIRTSDVGKFSISPSVPGLQFQDIGTTGYSYASFQVNPNTEYTLSAPDGRFLVTEYGHGLGRSYARNPYREVNNLNFEMKIEDAQIGEVEDDACLNSVLTFDIDFLRSGLSDEYTRIDWDFGDGETYTGKAFEKTYEEAGIYRISCTLSTDEDKCIITHTLYREIEVHEIIADRIEGPQSLCPNTEGIVYTLINDGGYIYDWEVEGGTIVGSDSGESITVNWGGIYANAQVTVYVSNEYGCSLEPIALDVVLEPSDLLEPAFAYGNEEVCFSDRDYQIYYTPDIDGAVFEWIVTGGQVVSGQGTHEVIVEWSEPEGTVYYILTLGECYGASPELQVKVYDELLPNLSVTDVLCFDAGNGKASVVTTGGKFPYTVFWSNGENGNSTSNLEPGDYSVLVEDDLGCQKELEFTIDEPALLGAEAFARKYCYGQADGEVSVVAQGGVAPYNYHLFSSSGSGNFDEESNSPNFTRLTAGRYTLVVSDVNQCTFNLTVDVEDPSVLEVNLVSNDPVCPGESNGFIAVEAAGGTGPYSYQWNNNSTGSRLDGIGEGDYEVTVTDANGCTVSMSISKSEMFPKMLFPNSFTPNGDGFNDFFSPISPCIPDYDMTIYDRWGKVVFQELDGKGIWDGTKDGEDMSAGVYAYYVTYENQTSNGTFTENIRGYVRLIR